MTPDPAPGGEAPRTAVHRLGPGDTGRWLVTTARGSQHLWDLDAMTYLRLPRPDSGCVSLVDERPERITRVEAWPEVGGRSLAWFDDPEQPDTVEHWLISSRIVRIELYGE